MRDAPTACRHTVSGTISLRSRGTFHHSLTVLSAIGHQGIFRLSGWSRQIHTGFLGPRATWVSLKRAVDVSATGVLPSTPDLSHVLRLHQRFLTRPVAGRRQKRDPTTPHAQPLPGITHIRFGLIRFRSPLLPESRLFSLPEGTEMFHFPSFPPHCLCVQQRVTAHDDCRVSPFGHPRIKARLTAPRGLSRPPTSFIGSWCQGIHRAPLKTWPQMLASTVQFSNNDQPPATPTEPAEFTGAGIPKDGQQPVPSDTQQRARPSQPAVLTFHTPKGQYSQRTTGSLCRIVNVPPMSNRARHLLAVGYVLLRKEVIQPHLPVRLPCYDFVPIASPTFDSSLPQGVGPPASGVTDFRDVTGGVYKARERIHRSNADLRLLATPTSWGRVADPNPN